MRTVLRLLLLSVFVAAPAAGALFAATPATAETLDKSADMQSQRKAFIEKLIAQGVLQKVEVPGSLPRAWVRPGFYDLDFDLKEKFMGVVYAFYFDGSRTDDAVRLFDSRTGKEIGIYTSDGLRLY